MAKDNEIFDGKTFQDLTRDIYENSQKKKLQIDSNFIHYKQAVITGSFSSNQKHLNEAFKIIKNKSIDFSKIVTSYAGFNNFKQKVKNLKNKMDIKTIFKPI